jgi:hypothetical protein
MWYSVHGWQPAAMEALTDMKAFSLFVKMISFAIGFFSCPH